MKCKHLLAAQLHLCCAHKADPVEGGEERMLSLAVYSKTVKVQKKQDSLLGNAVGFFSSGELSPGERPLTSSPGTEI